tara:strand:- start:665 stop:2467 length:1803 start_codon:yes stop_codon:yes gene_type:complete
MENSKAIVEIVIGEIKNRNVVDDMTNYNVLVENNAFKKEMYRSYYHFDDSFREHVEETGSVKGYQGACYIDYIHLDIDKGEIDDKSFNPYVMQCLSELLDKGVMAEDINVWFSGSGYHIKIKNVFGLQPSKELHTKLKLTLEKHFSFGDSIYDKTRIIRSEWSLNTKTGLYKVFVPMNLLQDYSYNQIKKFASSKTAYNRWSKKYDGFYDSKFIKDEIQFDPYLQSMIVASPTLAPVTNGNSRKGDVSNVVSCMQHVYNEGPVKGSRNMKLMRMASSYKRSGVPYLVALNGLLTWANGTLPDNEVIRSVSNTYEGNYVYSCKDHIMAEYCDPKCVYFKNKDYVLEINSIDILEQNLRNYINEDLTERSIDVGNMFDMQSYNFKPGELVVFSGDTGMGKSAFVQYVVTKAMKNVLYLSLEMKEELTFRRFGQMAIGQTQEWINNKYKTDPDFTLKDKLEHIQLMTIAPRIDSIKKIVAEYQPNVLVIDTADEVQVDFNRGEIEKQNIVIDGLKQIAQKNNIIIIAVSHLNKTSAASNVVALHSLKGSSNLVQKADKVLVIKGERTEKVRTISSEKSRDEDRFEMTVFFNTDNFTFRKLNES